MRFRPHREEDLEAFCAMEMDEDYRRYVGGRPRTYESAKYKFYHEMLPARSGDLVLWAIILKESEKYIGYCGIRPHLEVQNLSSEEGSLGFFLAKEYWGKGLATEVGITFLNWAFGKRGLKKVAASAEEPQLPARKTLEKLGFRQVKKEGMGQVFCYYEILPDEWSAWKQARMRPS